MNDVTPPERQSSLELWQMMLSTFFRLRQSVRPTFAEQGLTGPQWRVFRMLGETGGAGLTPGQISDLLRVTRGNTTGVLDKLEEAGLVERRPHPEDRRALLIGLTDRGEAMYKQVRPAFDEQVSALFSCLSEQEKQDMIDGLRRLLEHAERVQPAGDEGHAD